jgi:iron complex outermembrane receptor protein
MTSPPIATRRRARFAFGALAAVGLWLGAGAAGAASESRPKSFSLPAADATVALNKFAEQSGEQVIYLVEQVRGIRTNPVQGRFTAREAIERLIAETLLRVVEDKATGALLIQRRTSLAPPETARGPGKSTPPTKTRP